MVNNKKHPQIPLLLTRPAAGTRAFLDSLSSDLASQISVTASPLIEITGLNAEVPAADAVIFTSTHAPDFAGPGLGRNAYCVGNATTRKARDCGWNAQEAGQNADELVATLKNSPPHQTLIHLGGVHTRGAIAERLSEAGIITHHVALYDQTLKTLSKQATDLLDGPAPVLVPLFSARTAGQFARQARGHAPLHIVALSPAVAEQVSRIPHKTLTVCENPTACAMVNALKKLVNDLTLG